MAKPEIKMEISEKDKKLLLVLASVLIVALAYFFGYQKFTKQEKLYQEELAAAQAKEADLMEKAENIEDYIADTETYKKEFEEILGQYGSAITLPSNVDFINKAERATDVWMKSVAFSGTSPIYTFGQKLSSNPDYAEDLAYRTDMVGYKTTLSVAYEGEYAQWKELLK